MLNFNYAFKMNEYLLNLFNKNNIFEKFTNLKSQINVFMILTSFIGVSLLYKNILDTYTSNIIEDSSLFIEEETQKFFIEQNKVKNNLSMLNNKIDKNDNKLSSLILKLTTICENILISNEKIVKLLQENDNNINNIDKKKEHETPLFYLNDIISNSSVNIDLQNNNENNNENENEKDDIHKKILSNTEIISNIENRIIDNSNNKDDNNDNNHDSNNMNKSYYENYDELLDDCYDSIPCNNTKKAIGINFFKW